MASWRKKIATMFRVLWHGIRLMLFTIFAVVSAVGLWHSWTAKGSVDDRRAELVRLEEQLLEQKMRGEELQSRLGAFAGRAAARPDHHTRRVAVSGAVALPGRDT